MAVPTFLPPIPPDHEMAVEPSQKILESDFGEYVQRARQGINNQKFNISPQWTNLTRAEALPILAFLKERGRDRPFNYAAPEEPVRMYVCDSFSYRWKRGRRCDIGPCKFIETRVPS